MTTSIEFLIPGAAMPQPRPATQVRRTAGGKTFAHVYTPSRIKPWKKLIGLYAARHIPAAPWDGPVRVEISIALEREAQMKGPGWPADLMHADNDGSYDVDNLAKPIMDVLTEMRLWVDDCRVVKLIIGKLYVEPGGDVGAWVRCTLLDDPDDVSAARLLAQLGKSKNSRKRGGRHQLELIGPRDPVPPFP